MNYRTNTCGELTEKHLNKKVKLSGWINSVRDHGKIRFIDLRDRYGLTQLVINKESIQENLNDEDIISIEGEVSSRPKGTINDKIPTGKIEVKVKKLEILQKCSFLPFEVNKDKEVSEDLKLKYRYLDLRKTSSMKPILDRHEIFKIIRNYMNENGFVDIETPILTKSTPEGARDYLVPSRVNKGKFYALPQSPQIFKQLLMISGFDKYYQIARCFRDEDLRADRQPEFTQLDIEMSFINEEDIQEIIEGLMKDLFEKKLNVKLKTPFPRITYNEAMKKYKSDKPDLRTEKEKFAFCWVVDFPLFEWNEDENRYDPMHHPFTSPREEDIKLLEKDPSKVIGKCYDLVLNGTELGSGSIRIHDKKTQDRIFELLNISKKEADKRFGFLLEALKYAPPHGGIALGLDRIAAIMTGNESIRDVIAFPKNKAAKDLLTDAPADVEDKQLKELGIDLRKAK